MLERQTAKMKDTGMMPSCPNKSHVYCVSLDCFHDMFQPKTLNRMESRSRGGYGSSSEYSRVGWMGWGEHSLISALTKYITAEPNHDSVWIPLKK